MRVATFVIAMVSFGLAVASLAWEMVSWLYERGRVKVETVASHTVQLDGTLRPSILVIARNRRRLPVELRDWGFLFPDNHVLDVTGRGLWSGPEVPLTLSGLHTETWAVDLEPFKRSLANHGHESVQLRGFVDLGTGKRVASNDRYEVTIEDLTG